MSNIYYFVREDGTTEVRSGSSIVCFPVSHIGTLFGPVVGAIIVLYAEFLASLYAPERWPLVLGIIFVAAAMYARGGVGGCLYRLWRRGCLGGGSPKDWKYGVSTNDD
jgi:ABC-type branched-subunit amino acid transport system permease subunit